MELRGSCPGAHASGLEDVSYIRCQHAVVFALFSYHFTIWGEGIVFTWLLNIRGISADLEGNLSIVKR